MAENNTSSQSTLQKQVAEILEKSPSTLVRSIALELGISELEATRALPDHMRVCVPVSEFVAVWEEMSKCEKLTFLAESSGAIIEVNTQLPKGSLARGMYNLMDKSFALGGHILLDKLSSIWLVSKPAFNLESHSVQFFSHDGQCAFALFLGRDEKREILPAARSAYMSLWEKYINRGEAE